MGQSLRHMMWPWSRGTDPADGGAGEPEDKAELPNSGTVPEATGETDPGRQAVLDCDWPTATSIWGERALNDPKNARNHRHYIRALIRMERLYEAAAACDIARKHHRRDQEFLLRRLWLLDRLGIEDAFRKELRLPGVADAIATSGRMALITGRHFWRRGMLPTARNYFLMAANDAETGARARLHLARLDYRAGDLDQAEQRWTDILEDPESPGHPEEPYLFLGRIALKRGDLESAAALFSEAEALEPATAARIEKWMPQARDWETILPDTGEHIEAIPTFDSFILPLDDFAADIEVAPAQIDDSGEQEAAPDEEEASEADQAADIAGLIAAARAHLEANRLVAARETALHVLSLDESSYEACEIAGFASNRSADWENAAMAWGRLADLQPFRIGPLFQAASACEQLNDRTGALDYCERILSLEPSNETALAFCARQLARSGDRSGLETFAARVETLALETLPDRLVMALADGFSGFGAHVEAAAWIDRAFRDGACSPEIKLRKARLLYASGDFVEAAALWRDLIDAPATVVRPFEPHVFLARSAFRIGETGEAIEHFREAVRLNPGHLESRDGLISALLRHGDIHRADQENNRFRKDFPDAPGPIITHLTIGYLLMDRDEMLRRYATAIEAIGEDTQALIRLGRAIERQRDRRTALAHWQDMRQRFPDNVEILHRLVSQLADTPGMERNAREVARELLKIAPDHEAGFLQLAVLSQRLGDLEEAEKLYRRGITLFPANIGFWIGHGVALMRADKVAEGQAILDQARSFIDEADPVALADLAQLAELTDLPDKAETLYESAMQLAPANLQLYRRAVQFNLSHGSYGKAWTLATRAREIDRKDPVIVDALTKAATVFHIQDPDWYRNERTEQDALLVPDDIFPQIAATDWPRPQADRRGAMLITSTLGSGGSERQVMFSMQALARVDHGMDDIHLVARSLNPDHAHDFFLPLVRKSGFPVIDLGERSGMDFIRAIGTEVIPHRKAVRLAAAMPPEILAMALPLLGVFLKHRPEVVHTWQDTVNIAGGLAALLAGVPRIVMGTRSTRPDARRRMRRYLEPGYHAMLSLPNVTMVNNSRNGARDYEDWLGLEAGSVGVIHNGFDVDEIRASAERTHETESPESLGIPEGAQVIGGVMRFSEEKRPELFVDAAIALAPRLPETHFLLIGEGPLRVELRAKVAAAGLSDRIHMPGAKRPVEPWMNRMSILVLTSRMEGLPNVLIEAQILGVPVAATKVGGVPETMIENETGIMVDSGDSEVLADHLYQMAADRDRLQTMGLAARDWAESNFSLEGMIRNTLGFYAMPGNVTDRTVSASD